MLLNISYSLKIVVSSVELSTASSSSSPSVSKNDSISSLLAESKSGRERDALKVSLKGILPKGGRGDEGNQFSPDGVDPLKEGEMGLDILILGGNDPLKIGRKGVDPLKKGGNGVVPLKKGGNEVDPLNNGGNGVDPLKKGGNGVDPLKKGGKGVVDAHHGTEVLNSPQVDVVPLKNHGVDELPNSDS